MNEATCQYENPVRSVGESNMTPTFTPTAEVLPYFLTAQRTAELLKVSLTFLKRLRSKPNGLIPVRFGAALRYRAEDIRTYLTRCAKSASYFKCRAWQRELDRICPLGDDDYFEDEDCTV